MGAMMSRNKTVDERLRDGSGRGGRNGGRDACELIKTCARTTEHHVSGPHTVQEGRLFGGAFVAF